MKQVTISIPQFARQNVQIAYETEQVIDPSVTSLLAEIHKKHKQPRSKRQRPSKKIFKQPLVEFNLPEKTALSTTMTVTAPRIQIIPIHDIKTGRSRIITIRTTVEKRVRNQLTLPNNLRLFGWMLNWIEKVEPYQAALDAAYALRTKQVHHKPVFPIPINTKTAVFPNKVHSWFMALPKVLQHTSVLEPPKTFTVESDFDKPSRAKNPDVPDNLAFDVMGIQERVNEHLDYRPLDDRCFREACVQVGTGMDRKNLFLEPKHGGSVHICRDSSGRLERIQPEMGPPNPNAPYKTIVRGRSTKPQTFLDPQWLMAKLHCSFELAFELKEAFKRLDINTWQRASRIINGVTGTGKITIPFARWDDEIKQYVAQYATKLKGVRLKAAKGLMSYIPPVGPPDLRGLEHAITYLAKLARELEDVTVEWGNMIDLDLNEEALDLHTDPFWAGVELSPEEVPFIIDDLDQLGGDSNFFTGHMLAGDGSDGLPSVLIGCLKTASDFNLANLAKHVRPYWTNEGTDEEPRWIPPNRGMSDKQVSQFWAYWQARRAEIKSALGSNAEVVRYMSNLRALTTRSRAAAYIYALRDGKRFAERGTELHTAGVRVIPSALKLLWDEFNRMFAKPQVSVAVGMDIPY
jgi:hypothetical protein